MTRAVVSLPTNSKAWWKEAVVYQIYPASFCDSNGDGIGDLQGVISKLDYLKDLGVDVVWLSPIFKSPQIDMGYDISDYRDIHRPYGTVEDVEILIAELHKRRMRLILDLVVNHTSDEHAWFQESRSSITSPKRNWYIWRRPKYTADGTRKPPNNWKASFGGSVWEWDAATEEYYLHYYDKKMPDLNFENADLREAVHGLMKFWLDKGCDGFRMDVIGRISKDMSFPDAPITDAGTEWQEFSREGGPRKHEFIREMNRQVLSSGRIRFISESLLIKSIEYDIMTVGELNHVTPEAMLDYVLPERQEIQMGFAFDHVNIGLTPKLGRHIVQPWKLPELKSIFAKWQGLRDAGGWHALYLENHDQPRSISRFANDSPEWRAHSGKLLAMLHSTLFGTLYLHQGQEIGMINMPRDWPLDEYKDVQTQGVIKQVQQRGEDVRAKIDKVRFKARDNGRTPMQWSSEVHAGFSAAQPWMRIPDDHKTWNVEAQAIDPDSVLSFWRTMLALRRSHGDVLVYGTFKLLSPDHEQVFAYTRGSRILVILNFSEIPTLYSKPHGFRGAQVIANTAIGDEALDPLSENTLILGPYQGMVFESSRQIH